jgi:hypothetical protein
MTVTFKAQAERLSSLFSGGGSSQPLEENY